MSYDKIAKQWHEITGSKGGALKKYLLNDLIISKISHIEKKAILELGAGNGYFMSLLMRHFSGQLPRRIVITDQSKILLSIAQKNFLADKAEYQQLDIRDVFPFENNEFDIILATMLFNEITKGGLFRALSECSRVLADQGILLATVLHPEFILNLDKRGMLKRNQKGHLTMPGSRNLRLPVVKRKMDEYYYLLQQTGFQFNVEEIFPTKEILNEKKGLLNAGNCPIAVIFTCTKKKSE